VDGNERVPMNGTGERADEASGDSQTSAEGADSTDDEFAVNGATDESERVEPRAWRLRKVR
jgi:hypothetical protein